MPITVKENNAFISLPSLVKDKALVEQRRHQIVDAAVDLFIKNGFHKTTTRQIAKASCLSTGSLYEYVASKEDVLYLVCNSIHVEMKKKVGKAISRSRARKGTNGLDKIIKEYFKVCDQMQDFILLIYQEIKSLPKKWRKIVLDNEMKVTSLFKDAILELVKIDNIPPIKPEQLDLIAHNITVLGHMWTFRRWIIANKYSIDSYISIQTKNILSMYYMSSENNK